LYFRVGKEVKRSKNNENVVAFIGIDGCCDGKTVAYGENSKMNLEIFNKTNNLPTYLLAC
jgi:hypothetical protein